jgi:hypothetical protein
MKCPHCEKELLINDVVYYNLETYRGSVIATTNCCGKGVRVSDVVKIRVSTYVGDETEDSWGHPFKL